MQRPQDTLELRWASPRAGPTRTPGRSPTSGSSLTGLADGVYRLWADADPGDWFRETNETNNAHVDRLHGSR